MRTITLLVTRPKYDYTTRYISAWADVVIKEARSKGHAVLDLEAERACRKEIQSMLEKQAPALVFLNGHGNEYAVMGHQGEILLQAGENERLLANKVVYALSCRSARVLGVRSVVGGTRAYLGYKEDFIFMYTYEKRTRPADDKTAALFLNPSNQIPLTFLKGHTTRDAYYNGKKAYARSIRRLLSSQTSKDDTAALRYLLWDMENLVYHGDAVATV